MCQVYRHKTGKRSCGSREPANEPDNCVNRCSGARQYHAGLRLS